MFSIWKFAIWIFNKEELKSQQNCYWQFNNNSNSGLLKNDANDNQRIKNEDVRQQNQLNRFIW